jgi:hypothetical protein
MGYENSDPQSLLIYIQQQQNSLTTAIEQPKNIITPLSYNGRQPDLFQPGSHLFSFVIDDSNNILQSSSTGASITWELGTSSLSVSTVDISATNLCQRKYPNHCPTWIKNFCSDDSYCNGQESCVPNFIRQVSQEKFGMCKQPVRPLPCPDGMVCDESVLGCIQQRTTEPPTEINTESPTTQLHTGECTTYADCSGKNSFCLGISSCINNACQYDSNYRPCGNDMVNGTLAVGLGVTNVVCSDITRICFSYFTCSSDADCDDRLYCTGKEVCSDGICHPDNPIRCNNSTVLCTETDHCGTDGVITDEDTGIVVVNSTTTPTKAPTAAPTTTNSTSAPAITTSPSNTSLVIFLVVFAAVFLVLSLIVIAFIIRSHNNKIRAQTEASMTSSMNSRMTMMNSNKKK